MKAFVWDFGDDLQDTSARNLRGEPLPQSRFPEAIWWKYPRDKARPLPDAFHGGSLGRKVSAAFADMLRQFDPVRTAFYPLKLFQHDRVTSVGGAYTCDNFGETKAAVVPEACIISTKVVGGIKAQTGSSPKYWRMTDSPTNGNIAVTEAARTGVDLWLDPVIIEAIFQSNRLIGALRAAKLTRRLSLSTCRVILWN